MPHTEVVAITSLPLHIDFESQLQTLEKHIRNICHTLALQDIGNEWLIAWQEYGISNGLHDRFLSSKQKNTLKALMQTITQEFPKLTIVSGTVISKRWIDSKDPEKRRRKIAAIAEAYAVNSQYRMSHQFCSHEEQSENLIPSDFYLIKNTAYVFAKGKCIAKHDKITPFNETEPLRNGIFRPGFQKSQANIISPFLGIEICMEHILGVIEKSKLRPPLLQLVLSASTKLLPENFVSPYLIHIDSIHPLRLITNVEPRNAEFSLYSYNLLLDPPELTPVEPQTMRDHIYNYLYKHLENNYTPLSITRFLWDKDGNELLTGNDYLALLHLVITQYSKYALDKNAKEDEGIQTQLKNLLPTLDYLLSRVAPNSHLYEQKIDLKILLMVAVMQKQLSLISKLLIHYKKFLADELMNEDLVKCVIKNKKQNLLTIMFDKKWEEIINKPCNKNGDTPLHLAAKYDAHAIVTLLLEKHADTSKKNLQGHTAVMIAKDTSYRLLKRHQDRSTESVLPSHFGNIIVNHSLEATFNTMETFTIHTITEESSQDQNLLPNFSS